MSSSLTAKYPKEFFYATLQEHNVGHVDNYYGNKRVFERPFLAFPAVGVPIPGASPFDGVLFDGADQRILPT